MSRFERIIAELTIRAEQPFVMRSQLKALAKQLPFLYVMLCTNAVALAVTHAAAAPLLNTLLVPSILIPICIIRVIFWRRMVIDTLTDQQVAYQLRRTMGLVGFLGVSFTAWSLSLFPYGDAYAMTHVAFFMGITVVGCIFCLIHLRPAALALAAIVIIPFTIRFASTGQVVLTAIAINLLIVSIVMTFMMLAYYEDFRHLVQSRDRLAKIGDENKRAAEYDILTGLANRRRFFKDLHHAIEEHEASGTRFMLGLIDLDGFKPINDLHGHQAGDDVLIEVGRRLEALADDHVKVARLGGDEFALIVVPGDMGSITTFGHTLCKAVAAPIHLTCGVVSVTASIGFAVFPTMGQTHEQLMERADFALYHAKNHDRGNAIVFSETHAGAIRDRRQLEAELRTADADAEFFVMFQPLVDVAQSRITGFEALARWQSPTLGAVSPGAFIPAAERLGLIRKLTCCLFNKACAAARTWPSSVRLSFNLSVDDLMDDEAADRLLGLVEASGLPPDRLIFEVTETAVMQDFDRAKTTLEALRAVGCRIALDDFGTGYSSLSYVHKLPLDKIKIDQSFVRHLGDERAVQSIIMSILNLCTNLGMACVVEGVETAEHLSILRALGCNEMQGYLFGRPMLQDDALNMVESFEAKSKLVA